MNVQELLLENSFESVWDNLGFDDEHKEYFLSIYNDLIGKTIKDNVDNMTLKVEEVVDEDETYYSVVGYEDGDNQGYSISFVDWDKVAGYNVDLEDIPKELFIYELLSEVSFYGTEKDMVKERDELEEQIRGIENGTIKTFEFTSLSDLLNRCNEENKPDSIDFGVEGKELL